MRKDLEEAMKLAYRKGYEDREYEKDFDFHSHSYKCLDDFENRTCSSCKYYSLKEGTQPDGMLWKIEDCYYSSVVPELIDYVGCANWKAKDD